jgi:hypothetical protein
MLSRQEIDAMKKVMQNLGNVGNKSTVSNIVAEGSSALQNKTVSNHPDPNVQAMAKILGRFQSVTQEAKATLVEEAKENVRTRQLLNTEETSRGVRIADYHVVVKEAQWGNKTKNVYDIVDLNTNEVMYSDLALFESAAAITKCLLAGSSVSGIKCDQIYEADQTYARHLYDAAVFNSKIKRSTDLEQRAIYESKYTRSHGLAKEARTRILKSY